MARRNHDPPCTGSDLPWQSVNRSDKQTLAIIKPLGVVSKAEENKELVASYASDVVVFQQDFTQSPRHLAQNSIAFCMTKPIIDLLEVIQIEENQGRRAVLFLSDP